ncbi:uncharacterized protein Z518_04841 [Rhinocladiella mackenziei CBS 650.93]|uniref:Rhinocladiella mackenziei CBS 650.93 unplaced genomic scaffold supercont1.3, whole genome shotgun sequence n=1 Tax=Rhinocladiella mackenziei CBS 650.93 TaxID=1442369 RepID=A0A0D2JCM5_9EURO|nr:uncharacterized protein Z518_04841 [Rhinocladiella mackenziei CBS 650.93]KIX06865.1 hypothetical protein Z518_04841 [Rhinocladiella mackenziei CBS 650.93]
MPAPRRKTLLASRRRRQDDGEDEGSVVGDFEDDSLSEGSAVSNGDDEAENDESDSSGDEHESVKNTTDTTETALQRERDAVLSVEAVSKHHGAFKASADTEAMLHGLGQTEKSQETEVIHFDDLAAPADAGVAKTEVVVPKAPRHETAAQKSRREHLEYIRQRNTNPAFVPTRGGFFLHDDRNSPSTRPNARPFVRGRGRGYGFPAHPGRGVSFNEPTDKPWAHDLHEDHEMPLKPEQPQDKDVPGSENEQNAKSSGSTAPNRSFSFTTVLGNVTVQIYLPGMEQKLSIPNVVKKQYTLLPQHRPPLRRDKPVRVSIPDEPVRYIFPSTERSFIFIPRALRPNQQSYRGRGRGSFQGSRRPSLYGSAYTSSIAMSRKSSIGASTMRDGIRSPSESVISRMAFTGTDSTRPIVRMPSAVPTPSLSRTGMPIMNGQIGMNVPPPPPPPHMQPPAMYGSHSTTIPMHQPRPQKTVSVADIESPASFQFKAPQQQQEQPFHQQVPAHISNSYADEKATQPGQTVTGMAGATPLSQIPEGAVFAQGFQPYPVMSGPTYFGTPYNTGAVFYPPPADGSSFGVPMTGPVLAPNFIPGSQSHPVGYLPAAAPVESSIPSNMVAHESNGMVYYYNSPVFTPDTQGGLQPFPVATNGTMVAMANGMPPQTPFYYPSVPNGMFYPAQPE